jgi:hypothetical protein
MAIHVHPDMGVEVVAPEAADIDKVYQQVRKRAKWVKTQQIFFEQFHPLPHKKSFVSGETHLYLGRQYRLKLRKNKETSVKLIGKFFHVSSEDPNNRDKVKEALDAWYMRQAEKMFLSKTDEQLSHPPLLKLMPNKITIQRMVKRWGSCTKTGNIRLNLNLIKAPLYCIEYVIAHELCHLRVHDHSPSFYRLLSRLMPDWEKRKARLDAFIL